MTYGKRFLKEFGKLLKDSGTPDEYWTTFEYTSTGNNHCHALTLGLIARALSRIKETKELFIEDHLKHGKITWKPDIHAVSTDDSHLLIDFESPNSSDARVIRKDFLHFSKFLEEGGK